MRTPLAVASLLALAAPALAAGPRAQAVLFGFSLVPCLLLLAALPAALALRAAFGTPLRVERAAPEPGHAARLAGSLAVAAMVVALSATKDRPLQFWLLLLFTAALLLGLTVAATRLGRHLFKRPETGESTGAFVLGWLVLSGLPLLPVLGLLLLLWFASFGLGALLLSPFRGTAGTGATPEPSA